MHLNRLSWEKNLLVTIYINNFSRDTKRKASLTFSLVTTFIIISSLSFLINIHPMENVVATIASRNTTITATPPTIEAQSPVDAKTGAEIVLPPEKLVVIDPNTGQPQIIADAIIKDPVIRGGSLQQVTNEDGGEAFIDEGLGGGNGIIREDANAGDQTVDVLGDGGFLRLETDIATGAAILEDGTKSAPTFNPFFRSCDQSVHDVAKYSITGEVDKFRMKDNDFSLNIFADLIVNDLYNFDKKDKNYPYKANFKIGNDDVIKVDLDEFNTNCIDLVTIQNPKDAQVNLAKSEALKGLGFES
jgi:hypothetical protein